MCRTLLGFLYLTINATVFITNSVQWAAMWFITVAAIVSLGIIFAYRIINKRKHIFSKYHLYTLILNIFSLYLFAKMLEDVIGMETITKLDALLNEKMTHLWAPQLNEVVIFITNIASPLNLSLLSIFVLIVLILKKKWYYSVLLTMGMTGGGLFMLLIKLLMQRARPLNSLIEVSGYSFPSGHATIAILFFVTLLFAFKDDIKNSVLKIFFVGSTITAFLLVGFSRVYLNVHWFSDVIAGFSLGLFWLTLLILILKFVIASYGELIQELFLKVITCLNKKLRRDNAA